MIFSSLDFLVFFLAVFVCVVLLPTNRSKKILLLLASWCFYAYWDWRFLGLILLSTITDYWVGGKLGQTRSHKGRKVLLMFSLGVNLGLLGFFKYYNFFIESLSPIFSSLGLHVGTLDILLPVGISFYTFQTLSYTLDIYRRHMEPHESLLDFALFVGFFPQLVAGPIVRASHFLPQLGNRIVVTPDNLKEGFRFFVFGFVKKVFVADRIAIFVDPVFANAAAFDTLTLWTASVGYTLQIYFDFSGYSDMAIGLARVFGFDLGRNFDFPYLSRSVSEFWRRWHISLSSWVRDYLYIPLGGNRMGDLRTSLNLFVCMLVMGLWHGASWTFVAWGALHGVWLVVERFTRRESLEAVDSPPSQLFVDGLQWSSSFLMVNFSWVLFRAQSFDSAYEIINRMVVPTSGVTWVSPFVLFVFVATGIVHWMHVIGVSACFLKRWDWYLPGVLFSLMWLAMVFAPREFAPFIYFQF